MPTLTVTPSKGQFPLNANFSLDTSDMATILHYLWNFGDGKTSREKSPEHTYFMAGKYEGTVTISDESGNSWSTTFTIYVYDWDLTGVESGTFVSYTDKCYRLAIKASQGIGIVQWGVGGDLPFPEAYVGTVKGLNKANEALSIILDNFSGRFYQIGENDVWQDKVGAYGGTDINGMIRVKEQIGITGEDQMVEHIESRVHTRPFDEDNKNADGYTEKGFLENFRLNLRMYANGSSSPEAKLDSTIQYEDYIFGRRVENKRLQMELILTSSSFRITRIIQKLQNIDKITPEGIGGQSTERDFQRSFRGQDLWISRDTKTPLMNRASGSVVSGSYDSLVTGPDTKSESALSFLGADTLSVSLAQRTISGTTLSFWLNDLNTVGEIFKFDTGGSNDFIISIVQPSDTYLRLTNNVWTEDTLLSWSGTGWVLLSIASDGTNLYVYENGVLKGIIAVPAWLTTYGGTVNIVGAADVSMFDIRRVPRLIVSDSLAWYYDAVINYDGNGLLPVMR